MNKILFLLILMPCSFVLKAQSKADLIIYHAKIATMDTAEKFAEAIAINKGIVLATGTTNQIRSHYEELTTQVIDANGKTIIPGINDSHMHVIREGLNYNAELRWDGVKSLKRAMAMLKEQAARTPPGVWIKVIGGWNEFQFEEKRQPTIDEINEAVPDKPVFITYLYGKAFLNKKGIEVLGYNKDTKYEGSLLEQDSKGNLTGVMYAKQTPKAIYTTLALTTKLNEMERKSSTINFDRELNRFGITSVVDAAGGGQNFPSDYATSLNLAREGKLTVRKAYYLFAQQKGKEFQDYEKWIADVKLKKNDLLLVPNGYIPEGAGENIVASAADFENFLEPRIVLSDSMEADLTPIISLLVKNRWPFRLHATYGESIDRMLTVFEQVNKKTPFNGLRWLFDHAETITDQELLRVKALGGGVAVQFRMYYQGELYTKQYGKPETQLPPIKKMLALGIPVGMGTDATRISTYNPWMALHWLLTGKTIGGMQFWPKDQVLDRFTALQLYTSGSAWCSGEEKDKGKLVSGMYADLCILSDDYFTVEADNVRSIESVLTVMNGRIVYGAGLFKKLNPPIAETIPGWSPAKYYGGYQK